MFKFKNNTFHVTRGDTGTIHFSYKDGSVLPESDLIFKIYEKDALDSNPLLEKKVAINANATSVDLTLYSEETMIGDIENERVEYWYEIKLGPDNTILGYDENKAKIFYLYPSGLETKQ